MMESEEIVTGAGVRYLSGLVEAKRVDRCIQDATNHAVHRCT